MKKITLLMLALMLSVVAFAQKPDVTVQKARTPLQQAMQAKRHGQLTQDNVAAFKFNKPSISPVRAQARMSVAKQAPAKTAKRIATLAPRQKNQQARRSASRAAADFPIITEAPEGTKKLYKRAGDYTYVSGSSAYQGTQSGTMEIVFAANNDVYMKDPICGYQQSSYVKGTVSGTTITVPLSQNLVYSDYYDAAIATAMVNFGTEGAVSKDTETTAVTYTIDEEAKTITLNGTSDSKALSAFWTDDDSWSGASEWNTVLTETELIPVVTPPAGLVTEPWVFAAYFYDSRNEASSEVTLQIGFDDKDVYIQGISYYQPTAWIKGTLNDAGDAITLASGQYYGAYRDSYDMWFAAANSTTYAYEESITLAYDAVAGTITWPETALVLENGEVDGVAPYGYYTEIIATVKGGIPEPIAAPAGLLTEEWVFKATNLVTDDETGSLTAAADPYQIPVFVGIDGQDIWVQGLSEDMPETWIKGTLVDGKVTFPTGQHFGTVDFWGYTFEYFFAGYGANGMEDVVMVYDADSKTLTQVSPSMMLINAAYLIADPNLIFTGAVMKAIPDVAAVPAQPEITRASLASMYPSVSINVPTLDTEGNAILTSKLSYQYYTLSNGVVAPLTLTTTEYPELEADMTEIPYSFTDDWDIYNYRLYLNQDISAWDAIGIQSIYRGGDVENKSEISWYRIAVDAEIEVAEGDINAAITTKAAELAESGNKIGGLIIKLAEGATYTVSAPIESRASVVIEGNGAKIDASALTDAFIKMSAAPSVAVSAANAYEIAGVTIKDVTITGLPTQLFYANKTKYLLKTLTVENSIIGVNGKNNKTIFDFNGGGLAEDLVVNNSTIWANPTNAVNGGLYSTQSGSTLAQVGATQNYVTITNSTLYNIANGKPVSTLRQNSQTAQKYIVKNNIIVDCGATSNDLGQFLKGLNARQAGKAENWDVDGNVFNVAGADIVEDAVGGSEETIKNSISAVVVFDDAAKGDFNGIMPLLTDATVESVGDPRWTLKTGKAYKVQVGEVEHATIKVPAAYAIEDYVLPVTVVPETGYGVEKIVAKVGTVNLKLDKVAENEYTISMPPADIVLEASMEIAADDFTINAADITEGDINGAIDALVEKGMIIRGLTINLNGATAYKVTKPIEAAGNLVINGNGATIDASANEGAFAQLSTTPQVDFAKKNDATAADTDYYQVDKVNVKNVTVTGLKNSVFFDNNTKYVVVDFTIDNSWFQLATEAVAYEALISFQAGGAKDLTVKNSTFNGNNAVAKYFVRYNNGARVDRYGYTQADDTWSFTYENNTFYGLLISNGQWGNYNGVNQKAGQLVLTVKNNIWYDCDSQTLRRMNHSKNFTDFKTGSVVEKNTFWNSENGALDQGNYGNGSDLKEDPLFEDAANGKFAVRVKTLQADNQTGDYLRWGTWGDAEKVFNITIDVAEDAHGTVTAPRVEMEDNVVTITVAPETGYVLKSIQTLMGKSPIELTKVDDTTYTFYMPGADVTITAEFEEDTTGILGVQMNSTTDLDNAVIYNLQGQRVEKSQAKGGMFIVNGKKVVLK